MGIQDRDYYREGSRGLFDAWGRQGPTVWLVVITSVVFFVQCFAGPPLRSPLVEVGCYSYPAIIAGEVWRLLTPLFLHASLWHLFFNMLILYWAGTRLEDIYGPSEFLTFYLIAGIFANGVNLLSQAIGAPQAPGIGASGAVTATLVLFAFHFPWQRVYVWFVLPMPVWVVVVLYVGLDGLGAAGVGRGGIGYIVHLGGALFGAIYYQTGIRFAGLFSRSRRPAARRARPALRVVPPPEPEEPETPEPVGAAVENQPRPKEAADENLEAKVDQVLAKVSKYGQESLTPEEREILFKASELYKKRRK
jgi:membrane associated rhomboid family serine protease